MNRPYRIRHGGRRPGPVLAAVCPLALLLLCVLSRQVGASTEAEDNRGKAPMPHESLGAHGAMVKVHLVSALSYLVGRAPNDDVSAVSLLHAEVADCVRDNNRRGVASRPPRVWPDHVNSDRTDTYSAINRTIVYSSGLGYGTNPLDCSLVETRFSKAHLSSTLGSCAIDLMGKTARGACDATGQAHARPPTRLPGLTAAQIAAIERNAAGNPSMALLAAALRSQPSAGTGQRKTLLGLECDVWSNPLDPDGTICLSRGGSFASSAATGDVHQSAMGLEGTTVAGIKMWATNAQLDVMVDAAVFTPYLAGGFRIISRGARR